MNPRYSQKQLVISQGIYITDAEKAMFEKIIRIDQTAAQYTAVTQLLKGLMKDSPGDKDVNLLPTKGVKTYELIIKDDHCMATFAFEEELDETKKHLSPLLMKIVYVLYFEKKPT